MTNKALMVECADTHSHPTKEEEEEEEEEECSESINFRKTIPLAT